MNLEHLDGTELVDELLRLRKRCNNRNPDIVLLRFIKTDDTEYHHDDQRHDHSEEQRLPVADEHQRRVFCEFQEGFHVIRAMTGLHKEYVLKVRLLLDNGLRKSFVQQRPDQRAGRIQRDNAAPIHDSDPVAQHFGFVHIVGRDQYCCTACLDFLHQLPEITTRLRVQSRGGFVQEQHNRLVDQGDCDGEPLFLTAGEFLHLAAGFLLHADIRQERHRINRAFVHCCEQLDDFFKRQIVEEGRRLQLHADDVFDLVGLMGDVQSVHRDGTRIRVLQTFHDLQGCGLSGPHDQAERLSAPHIERNTINGGQRAIPLDQIADFNDILADRCHRGLGLVF